MTISAAATSTMLTVAAASAVLPAAGRDGHSASTFEAADIPSTIYQTSLVGDGVQDGATPLVMKLKLSSHAASALTRASRTAPLSSFVHVAIRRMDLRELETYDAASGLLLGLRLSQAMFEFEMRGSSLAISVHRKELPVSANFGDSPFVFVVLLKPVDELVVSPAFHIASKEPVKRAPRPPPKRVRAPSVRVPVPAVASGAEADITAHCKSLKKGVKRARADSNETADSVASSMTAIESESDTDAVLSLSPPPACKANDDAVAEDDMDAVLASFTGMEGDAFGLLGDSMSSPFAFATDADIAEALEFEAFLDA